MSDTTRKNQSGGSAMGGGADYQAEAYALVAAKIMAQEALNWAQTDCDCIPISVRMETGSGGDDLLISLRHGNKIELQAKQGLQRGQALWDALMALAHAVHNDSDKYGVLLTNTDASGTIREELKKGIERIGADFDKYDELPDIVQDFVRRLETDKITPKTICERLFVIVWNFEPGSTGEEITLNALRNAIAQPEQAGMARGLLVSDGMDCITLRGGRDAVFLSKFLQGKGVALSHTGQNLLVVRQAYLQWCVKRNDTFSIPSLQLALPMEKAWMRLRTMRGESSASSGASLEEQLRNYHEWHRLAETNARSDSISIEIAARLHRLLIVIAGPGAGKSTLLRRLAYAWAQEDKLLLHVSLRRVSQRISQGITFEEAVRDTALDTFDCALTLRSHLLKTANYLLADGLDETDPNHDEIARHLNDWALADDKRRVVVTTRPIGHNPAWFTNWEYTELLPLDESDVRELANNVFAEISALGGRNALNIHEFTERLKQSQATRLASRSPLLLGFLIALYSQGEKLENSRYRLFAEILDRISKQSRNDRVSAMNEAESRRAIDCLGWLLMKHPTILEPEMARELGRLLAASFSVNEFLGEQKAREALKFWEERGLIEEIGVGAQRTYTFIYMMFQEFAAARYLERVDQDKFTEWVNQHYTLARYREVLLLTGGTSKATTSVETLLNLDNADDPVSTAGLVAAEVLAEIENPPEALRKSTVDRLAQRLTSPIPLVAYEAGDSLIPFVPAAPALIGPMAYALSIHEQKWTREVACALSLMAGPEYINEEVLIAIYPTANDMKMRSGQGQGLSLHYKAIGWELIVRGAEWLLRKDAPEEYVELVKQKYIEGQCSVRTVDRLYSLLSKRFPLLDMESLRPSWRSGKIKENMDAMAIAHRQADKAFLEALIKASDSKSISSHSYKNASEMGALGTIYQVLQFMETPITEIYVLRERPFETELIEVLRGAILVTALDPSQVSKEAEQVLGKLDTPHHSIFNDIDKTSEFNSGRDIDWSLAANGELDPEVLFHALSHPSYFVCKFTTLLLENCFDTKVQRHWFGEALATGSAYALYILANNAKEIWQSDAPELICSRLEQNLTPKCAPLVKCMGRICDASFSVRATNILRQALSSTNAEMVEAGLLAMQELRLNAELANVVQERYFWWLREGPPPPITSGTVPPNAADSLLKHLIAQGSVTEADLTEAAKVGLSEVRSIAVKEICRRMEADGKFAEKILDEVFDRKLPLEIFKTLSQSQSDVCKKHQERIMTLLTSNNRQMRLSCIHALGDGWVEHNIAEEKLRSFFQREDTSLRDEAIRSLRRLELQRK